MKNPSSSETKREKAEKAIQKYAEDYKDNQDVRNPKKLILGDPLILQYFAETMRKKCGNCEKGMAGRAFLQYICPQCGGSGYEVNP